LKSTIFCTDILHSLAHHAGLVTV